MRLQAVSKFAKRAGKQDEFGKEREALEERLLPLIFLRRREGSQERRETLHRMYLDRIGSVPSTFYRVLFY